MAEANISPRRVIHNSPGFRIPDTELKILPQWIPDSKRSVFRDSGFLDLDSRFQRVGFRILDLDSGFQRVGFWILDLDSRFQGVGFRILDLDSGFQRVEFRISQVNVFRISDFTSKRFLNFGIRIIPYIGRQMIHSESGLYLTLGDK